MEILSHHIIFLISGLFFSGNMNVIAATISDGISEEKLTPSLLRLTEDVKEVKNNMVELISFLKYAAKKEDVYNLSGQIKRVDDRIDEIISLQKHSVETGLHQLNRIEPLVEMRYLIEEQNPLLENIKATFDKTLAAIELNNAFVEQLIHLQGGKNHKKTNTMENGSLLSELVYKLDRSVDLFEETKTYLLKLADIFDAEDRVLSERSDFMVDMESLRRKIFELFETESGKWDVCGMIPKHIIDYTEYRTLLIIKLFENATQHLQENCNLADENVIDENDKNIFEESSTVAMITSTLTSKITESPTESIIEESLIRLENKTNCHELQYEKGHREGIYDFSPLSYQKENFQNQDDYFKRFCSFPTKDSGWTVIQERESYQKQENFNRSWEDYKNGFGSFTGGGGFWLGNRNIHRLTGIEFDENELLIELVDFNDTKEFVKYSHFSISSESDGYKISLNSFDGDIEDSFSYHNNKKFSTYDRNNDHSADPCCPCSVGYGSGWWFDDCSLVDLNGIYRDTPHGHNYVGIMWEGWHGDYSLKATRMYVRPKVVSTKRILLDP